MSLKTFKVQSGLDIDGVVLSASASELLVSGSVISTEAYVDSAIAAIPGVTVDSTGGINNGANGLAINTGSGLVVDVTNSLIVDTNTIATKTYVDGVAQGLDVKQSVRVATTESVTSSTDFDKFNSDPEGIQFSAPFTPTIDGETINDGDRVLVKNEDSPNNSFNGIWVWDAANTKFVRANDADNPTDLNTGAFTFVEKGSANGGKGFVANVTLDAAEDFQSIVWTQFSEAGTFITSVDTTSFDVSNGELGLSASVAGDGLTLSNGELALDIDAAGGIVVGANGLALGNDISLFGSTTVFGSLQVDSLKSIDSIEIEDINTSTSKTTVGSGQIPDAGTNTFDTLLTVSAYDTTIGDVLAYSGEFFVTSELTDGSTVKRRVSKISWLWDGDLAAPGISYNEYSIIETGGSIPGYDLQVTYFNDNVVLQHKATLLTGETLTSQATSTSNRPPKFTGDK